MPIDTDTQSGPPSAAGGCEPGSLPPSADSGPDWLSVAMGNDNPYFEFRQPGDPGGIGFYKWYSQVQVFDTGTLTDPVPFNVKIDHP